jgi:hypothetical protein
MARPSTQARPPHEVAKVIEGYRIDIPAALALRTP